MGILSRLFSKPKIEEERQIILGMVLLPTNSSYSYTVFFDELRPFVNISDESEDGAIATFKVGDAQVYLAYMDFPVPSKDIEGTAKYAYNWMSAVEDLKDHGSHIIIAISSTAVYNIIEKFKLHTKVICAMLTTGNAIGVYLGEQSLLIPKKDYLAYAGLMTDEDLPLNLWLYFGMRTIDEKTNGYTHGLKAFGKDELEVIESSRTISEIREWLFNITHYVLLSDIVFKDGQTAGLTQEEKIKITHSKGRFVEGLSFKFAY
jgi:hypothetical protein